jgi:hypothetical protein
VERCGTRCGSGPPPTGHAPARGLRSLSSRGFFDILPAQRVNDWTRYILLDWWSPDPSDSAHPSLAEDAIRRDFLAVPGQAGPSKWSDVFHQFVIFGGQDFNATPQAGQREPAQITRMTFFERCLRTSSPSSP